jgi:hypothetical protein
MYPDLADQFQTGDPSSQSPGWSGGDFTGELDFNNLFGDGGDFGG